MTAGLMPFSVIGGEHELDDLPRRAHLGRAAMASRRGSMNSAMMYRASSPLFVKCE